LERSEKLGFRCCTRAGLMDVSRPRMPARAKVAQAPTLVPGDTEVILLPQHGVYTATQRSRRGTRRVLQSNPVWTTFIAGSKGVLITRT
jgi:hypothetical protein